VLPTYGLKRDPSVRGFNARFIPEISRLHDRILVYWCNRTTMICALPSSPASSLVTPPIHHPTKPEPFQPTVNNNNNNNNSQRCFIPPSQRPQVWKRGRLKKMVKNRKVNERTDKENHKALGKEVNQQRRGRLSEEGSRQ